MVASAPGGKASPSLVGRCAGRYAIASPIRPHLSQEIRSGESCDTRASVLGSSFTTGGKREGDTLRVFAGVARLRGKSTPCVAASCQNALRVLSFGYVIYGRSSSGWLGEDGWATRVGRTRERSRPPHGGVERSVWSASADLTTGQTSSGGCVVTCARHVTWMGSVPPCNVGSTRPWTATCRSRSRDRTRLGTCGSRGGAGSDQRPAEVAPRGGEPCSGRDGPPWCGWPTGRRARSPCSRSWPPVALSASSR